MTYHHGAVVVADVVHRQDDALAVLLTAGLVKVTLKANAKFIIVTIVVA